MDFSIIIISSIIISSINNIIIIIGIIIKGGSSIARALMRRGDVWGYYYVDEMKHEQFAEQGLPPQFVARRVLYQVE